MNILLNQYRSKLTYNFFMSLIFFRCVTIKKKINHVKSNITLSFDTFFEKFKYLRLFCGAEYFRKNISELNRTQAQQIDKSNSNKSTSFEKTAIDRNNSIKRSLKFHL